MKSNGEYDWKFSTVGGMTRVSIHSGEDLAHLDELDKKLWTVLSCPTRGLEFDQRTLDILDANKDGKIHVDEVVSASKWLTSVISDLSLLTKRDSSIPLSAFNLENEEGRSLYESAQHILAGLGLEKDSISLGDVSDSLAIFAKTRFNGDGVITVNSAEDDTLKKVIEEIIASSGSVVDRSGDKGVNAEIIEKFFADLSDFTAWKEAGDADKAEVFPYGDNTEAALAAYESIKAKVDDFFVRCSLASFSSAGNLDVTAEKIGAISDKNLAASIDEIAQYPLAKVNAKSELPLDGGINPAWQGTFSTLKKLVFDAEFPEAASITKSRWESIQGRFAAYKAWKDAKKGISAEALGYGRAKEILVSSAKDSLLELVAQDKSLEKQFGTIESVDKLLHLYRDFYTFVRNYVTFSDFYSHNGRKAIFQAGTLFIDQRSCDLCIKVNDMTAHNNFSGLSGMFIIYCDCIYKSTGEKMTIAAVLTDGDIDNIKVGKHAVFYDRDGKDFDATVTKIIDNPISVRQAFWSPYRKVGNFLEEQVTKFASTQDSKVTADATKKLAEGGSKLGDAAAADATKKSSFDMTKFFGLFAVIGMALGSIFSFLLSLFTGFFSLAWWQMPLVVLAVMLIISGPSMIMAYMKLRKRDLAPLLNANGWAVNAKAIVNVRFGQTLTSMARTPYVKDVDPYGMEGLPVWKRTVIGIVIGLCLLVGVYFIIPVDKRPFWNKTETPDIVIEEVQEVPVDTEQL